MKLHYFLVIATLATLCSCNPYDIEEVLTGRDEMSLTYKGEDVLVYDPATCQMCYNEENQEYRIFTDDMSSYFYVKCSTKPTDVGQELKADVRWTGNSSTISRNDTRFIVKKTDDKGSFWLWSKSAKIGIVIRQID